MPKQKPSENAVREYLIENPEFFDFNKDLLGMLKPSRPKPVKDVVDFQSVLLDRLQSEICELRELNDMLIHGSRSNMTTQARIHAAVLCLLEAEDIDHLCHIVCNDWVDMLQVDVITLSFEKNLNNALPDNPNIRYLKRGTINRLLGHENAIMLRGNTNVDEDVYGPATPLIKAEALIRIAESEHHPLGVLAFGSRNKGLFTPGQGTELLRFLEATFQCQLLYLLSKSA